MFICGLFSKTVRCSDYTASILLYNNTPLPLLLRGANTLYAKWERNSLWRKDNGLEKIALWQSWFHLLRRLNDGSEMGRTCSTCGTNINFQRKPGRAETSWEADLRKRKDSVCVFPRYAKRLSDFQRTMFVFCILNYDHAEFSILEHGFCVRTSESTDFLEVM